MLILLGQIWLLVRVCNILTPLLLYDGLGVLRCSNLLLAPGSWLRRNRLCCRHRGRLHVDDWNQLIDNGEKIGRLWIPVLQVGDRDNVLLSDIVKFLDNFKGELFVEVDPRCSEWVVTG